MRAEIIAAVVIALSSYALSRGLAALLHGRNLRKRVTA